MQLINEDYVFQFKIVLGFWVGFLLEQSILALLGQVLPLRPGACTIETLRIRNMWILQ